MPNSEIQTAVQEFASNLEAAFRENVLRSVEAALGGARGAGPKAKVGKSAKKTKTGVLTTRTTPAHAKKTKATKRKRVRRTPADLDRDVGRLTAYVRSNPGATSEKVRAALGMEKTAWIPSLRQAVDSKVLSTKGVNPPTTSASETGVVSKASTM